MSVVSERDEAVAQSKGTGANTSLPLVLLRSDASCVDRDLSGEDDPGGEIEAGAGHVGGEEGERDASTRRAERKHCVSCVYSVIFRMPLLRRVQRM